MRPRTPPHPGGGKPQGGRAGASAVASPPFEKAVHTVVWRCTAVYFARPPCRGCVLLGGWAAHTTSQSPAGSTTNNARITTCRARYFMDCDVSWGQECGACARRLGAPAGRQAPRARVQLALPAVWPSSPLLVGWAWCARSRRAGLGAAACCLRGAAAWAVAVVQVSPEAHAASRRARRSGAVLAVRWPLRRGLAARPRQRRCRRF